METPERSTVHIDGALTVTLLPEMPQVLFRQSHARPTPVQCLLVEEKDTTVSVGGALAQSMLRQSYLLIWGEFASKFLSELSSLGSLGPWLHVGHFQALRERRRN
jgi:hypothetical protein